MRMMDRHTKLIGLIGGMSWESSALYYRLMNVAAREKLGGHHNAHTLMETLDFHDLNIMAANGEWQSVAGVVGRAAQRLEAAGAAFVMITAVSPHIIAEQIEAAIGAPLLHIGDPAGAAMREAGFRRVGLLGTRYTMELPFFRERLERRFGLDVLTPEKAQVDEIHRIIIEELTLGEVRPRSSAFLRDVAAHLAARGAQAIVVACTELPILLPMEAYPVPAVDVVKLHAEAAIDLALRD